MKRVLMICAALAFGVSASVSQAEQTAYEALRAVGAQKGQAAIGKVLSVSGKNGSAQPRLWQISLEDSTARSGVREFEVMDGSILSESAPVRTGSPGPSMDLAKLNLDSDGAFKVANQEAAKKQIGFDSANYSLSADASTGAPYWTVELVDYKGRVLGRVEISATNGSVRSVSGEATGVSGTASKSKSSGNGAGNGDGNFLNKAGSSVRKVGRGVKGAGKNAAGTVQEWITGKRTIYADPEPNESGSSSSSVD